MRNKNNEVVEENVEVEPVEEIEQIEPVEETEQVETSSEPLRGVVVNCNLLNVRASADPEARVLCTIKALDEVMIDESKTTAEFYNVYTETGVEGYCVKKFIAV